MGGVETRRQRIRATLERDLNLHDGTMAPFAGGGLLINQSSTAESAFVSFFKALVPRCSCACVCRSFETSLADKVTLFLLGFVKCYGHSL